MLLALWDSFSRRLHANERLHLLWCCSGVIGCLVVYGVLQASLGLRGQVTQASSRCFKGVGPSAGLPAAPLPGPGDGAGAHQTNETSVQRPRGCQRQPPLPPPPPTAAPFRPPAPLQERIMQGSFDGETFTYSLFLVLCNRLTTMAVAVVMLLVRLSRAFRGSCGCAGSCAALKLVVGPEWRGAAGLLCLARLPFLPPAPRRSTASCTASRAAHRHGRRARCRPSPPCCPSAHLRPVPRGSAPQLYGQDMRPVAPPYSYAAVSVSNVSATFCQYEALKHVSFPMQVGGAVGRGGGRGRAGVRCLVGAAAGPQAISRAAAMPGRAANACRAAACRRAAAPAPHLAHVTPPTRCP